MQDLIVYILCSYIFYDETILRKLIIAFIIIMYTYQNQDTEYDDLYRTVHGYQDDHIR